MNNILKALYLTTAVAIWGLSYSVIKILLNHGIQPITVATLRHIVFFPLFLYLIKSGRFKRYSIKDYKFFATLSFFTIFLPNITQNIGMEYTSASISSVIQSTSPIFTIILAFAFLGESRTLGKIVGSTLALIGTILLATGGSFVIGITTYGSFLILISSISYAISGLLIKRGLKSIPVLDLLSFEITFGFIMLLIPNIFLENMMDIMHFTMDVWMYIIFLSVMASFVSSLLYYIILYEEELSYLVIFTYLIPVFAILFSYWILGEIMSLKDAVFAFVVLLGVIVAQLSRMRSVSYLSGSE